MCHANGIENIAAADKGSIYSPYRKKPHLEIAASDVVKEVGGGNGGLRHGIYYSESIIGIAKYTLKNQKSQGFFDLGFYSHYRSGFKQARLSLSVTRQMIEKNPSVV